jgi:hypothetical protein
MRRVYPSQISRSKNDQNECDSESHENLKNASGSLVDPEYVVSTFKNCFKGPRDIQIDVIIKYLIKHCNQYLISIFAIVCVIIDGYLNRRSSFIQLSPRNAIALEKLRKLTIGFGPPK